MALSFRQASQATRVIANSTDDGYGQEVVEASAAMATCREAEGGGVGAIGRDGRLLDAPHMRLTANTLRKAWVLAAPGKAPARRKRSSHL